MKTFGTLFSGGELFGVGAVAAGYTPLWGIEKDDKIAKVARLNGFPVITGDVLSFDFATLDRPNHIHASPPCPNYSRAKTGGEETELDIAMAGAVRSALHHFEPDTFTLENVVGYRNGEGFKKIGRTLSELGYWWDATNLNSADFGREILCPIHDIANYVEGNLARGIVPEHVVRGVMTSSSGLQKRLAYDAVENLVRAIKQDSAVNAIWRSWESAASQEKQTLIGRAENILTNGDMSELELMASTGESIALLLKICLDAPLLRERLFTMPTMIRQTILQKILLCLKTTVNTVSCTIEKDPKNKDGRLETLGECPLCTRYAVPQTRERLWIRASRGLLMGYPPPVPWKGWYEAIEDLIPSLPDAEFAPWQMARLPEEYKTLMIGQGTYSAPKPEDEPADTITSNHNQGSIRAFVMQVQGENGKGYRESDEPMQTLAVGHTLGKYKAFIVGDQERQIANADRPAFVVRSDGGGSAPRAFIFDNGNTNRDGSFTRGENEPAHTVIAQQDRTPLRAFVLDGQTNEGERITARDGEDPIFTVSSSGAKRPTRAYVGRVVKLDIRCLGRFQTVPDSYQGLTVKINGNGVPCLEAQRVLETFP